MQKSSGDAATQRLTDVAGYTGAHKVPVNPSSASYYIELSLTARFTYFPQERFDAETGKGKGVEGRVDRDAHAAAGYVGGYKVRCPLRAVSLVALHISLLSLCRARAATTSRTSEKLLPSTPAPAAHSHCLHILPLAPHSTAPHRPTPRARSNRLISRSLTAFLCSQLRASRSSPLASERSPIRFRSPTNSLSGSRSVQ